MNTTSHYPCESYEKKKNKNKTDFYYFQVILLFGTPCISTQRYVHGVPSMYNLILPE